MPRHVFVVARDSSYLASYLRDRFKDTPEVDVIMDRRRAQRRRQAVAVSVDRRNGDRRIRPEADAELRLASCVFVTVPDPVR